jgi:hypothetical protein
VKIIVKIVLDVVVDLDGAIASKLIHLVIIRGVVTDNIAGSSGKIVIEVGTKVLRMGAYRRPHGTNKVVWHLDSRDRLPFLASPGQASGIRGRPRRDAGSGNLS